jgi:pimeloyl-ACP methyl ester carboxylesterase
MREMEIGRGGRVLRVRDAGDPDGTVAIYFHGTPGSRLDLCYGEQLAAERGVRLISFDRPGYGGSTPAPFGLASIAADAHAVADELGVARFATLGMSGGGPGALAAAAVPGGRVSRAGIASGAGPFQLVPGALGELDDNDRAAMSLLPGDLAAAASAFAAGFEPLAELARVSGGAGVASAFEDLLSSRDSELLQDERYAPGVCGNDARGIAPGNQRRWLGQRVLDRTMGHRPEHSPLPGSAVVRQRRPLRPARARIVAVSEPAQRTTHPA